MTKISSKIKTLFMLVLLFTMNFVLLSSTLAAEKVTIITNSTVGTIDSGSKQITNTGNLTVNEVPTGDTLSAYKILDAYYNESTNVITYEFTDSFKSFLTSTSGEENDYSSYTVNDYANLTNGDNTSVSTKTNSTLDKLASLYAAYIKENGISGTAMTTSDDSRVVQLAVGSYLILPTLTSNVYAVIVGNIELKANESEKTKWDLPDYETVAKVSDPGTLLKAINVTGTTSKSFNIGDEYSYILTATLPTYPTNATNKTYVIEDVMDAGITFNGLDKMKITDNVELNNTNGEFTDVNGNVVANVSISGQTLTIDVDVDYVKTNTLTIEYKAKLNEDAVIGGTGNVNTATLTYSNDPYHVINPTVNAMNTIEAEPAETTAYTYGIEILKYVIENEKSVSESLKLDDAVFKVINTDTNKEYEITTSDGGKVLLTGIEEGTYSITEIKVPAGYIINENIDDITVDANTIESTTPKTQGHYYLEIPNMPAIVLPFTGGIGTIVFTVVGLCIVLVGSIAYVIYRKKSLNDEEK